MERARFCSNCGKLLDHDWRRCPWCEDDLVGAGVLQNVHETTQPIEREEPRFRILDELTGKLEALESELDIFLADRRR